MTVKQIPNPGGVWGATADPGGAQEIAPYVNNSGGTLREGDVVVGDVNGVLATTTTTVSDKQVVGVVGKHAQGPLGAASETDTFGAGAIIPVIVRGPARINIAANTVAAGDPLAASAAAKVAATPAAAASVAALQALVGSFIAVAAEANGAKDANNTIRCYVSKM